MKPRVVMIIGAANGLPTPHDGRYVVAWNPHTPAGICEVTTTSDIDLARRWIDSSYFTEWRTVSNVQPTRYWDGKPNRPLTGLNILSEDVDQ